MGENVEEHAVFVPKLEETEQWLKDIQAGKEKYDAQLCIEKVTDFADPMIAHLEHVSLSTCLLHSTITDHTYCHAGGANAE